MGAGGAAGEMACVCVGGWTGEDNRQNSGKQFHLGSVYGHILSLGKKFLLICFQ